MEGNVLAVIPARGGSQRIPKKNIKEFLGKPIIAYSIETLLKSGVADDLIVSTDDTEISETSKRYGAEVPFLRSTDNANSSVGIAPVLMEVIERLKEQGRSYSYLICMLATAPLIREADIKHAFEMLVVDKEADSICAVERFSYPPQRGLISRGKYIEMKHPEEYETRSQDLEPVYHDCGAFFIFRMDAFIKEKKLYTQHMLPYIVESSRSQDIDNYEDWKIAELKYKYLIGDLK